MITFGHVLGKQLQVAVSEHAYLSFFPKMLFIIIVQGSKIFIDCLHAGMLNYSGMF